MQLKSVGRLCLIVAGFWLFVLYGAVAPGQGERRVSEGALGVIRSLGPVTSAALLGTRSGDFASARTVG